MMEWITIISLITFGLALLVAEIIFVPGTTLVGVVGFIFLILGVALSFHYFGSESGWVTTGVTAAVSGFIFYYSFTTNVWSKFSLKSANNSKVNEGEKVDLKEGMEGTTISALRPIGKAELNNQTFEVKTLGTYLDSGKKIRIVKVIQNQIIVEPIN